LLRKRLNVKKPNVREPLRQNKRRRRPSGREKQK
jgi:hypothetical protein